MKYISKYGDDGPDGRHTLLNIKTLQEYKYDLFNDDQKKDKKVCPNRIIPFRCELTRLVQLSFPISRQLTAYAESTFTLELMQDGKFSYQCRLEILTNKLLGRTNTTSMKQLKSFFQNQTFGPNFYRRGAPAGITLLGPLSSEIRDAHPIAAGKNDANGNYILDTPASTNFVSANPIMEGILTYCKLSLAMVMLISSSINSLVL
jgi:hypothetical protein